MRRVLKRRPPANISPPHQQPCSMVQAAAQFKVSLAALAEPERKQHARDSFDSLHKEKLREALCTEQHGLCVYCESRVKATNPQHTVEHWNAISHDPELALEWKNLYLSCATRDTCDRAKGSRKLAYSDAHPSLPWPAEFA